MRHTILKYVVATLFTAALAYLLTWFVDIPQLATAIEELSITAVLVGFALYTAMNLVRVERYKALLKTELSYRELASAVFLQNFYNNLLPFRLGEASFPVLLRNQAEVEDSVSAVVVSRFFDALSLIFIFFTALLFLPTVPDALTIYLYWFLAGLFVLILLIPLTLLIKEQYLRWFCFHPYIDVVVDGFLKERKDLYRLTRKDLAVLSTSSIAIWALSIAVYAVIINDLSAALPLSFIAIGVVFVVFSSLLPMQSFLQLGTVELAWAAPLIVLGVSESSAFTAGIIIHAVRLAYVFILAGSGLLLRWAPSQS